jgi:energy-coupling factor transporter ATP-binding protein EcfA2
MYIERTWQIIIYMKQLTQQENTDDGTLKRLQAIVSSNKRVAVTGAPTSGKTYLTSRLQGCTVVHGDELTKDLEWSQSSEVMSKFVNALDADHIVIEGVQVPRAIRKGMKVDVLVVLPMPANLDKRHVGMSKSIATVIKDCDDKGLLDSVKVVFL